MARGKPTLVRFVIRRRDPESHQPMGVFQASHQALESGQLPDYETNALREALDWFNQHLPEPARFSRSMRHNACHKAISWFKCDAVDCLKQIEIIVRVLSEAGMQVDRITTSRPGYVLYEDTQQVVAEPFRGDE